MKKKDGEPTFEKYLEKLEAVMQKIEKGESGLQETISMFEEGMKLVKTCRGILEKAELRINRLVDGGTAETEPFGDDEADVVD